MGSPVRPPSRRGGGRVAPFDMRTNPETRAKREEQRRVAAAAKAAAARAARAAKAARAAEPARVADKHDGLVRVTHWAHVALLLGLILTGLAIYWAAPVF